MAQPQEMATYLVHPDTDGGSNLDLRLQQLLLNLAVLGEGHDTCGPAHVVRPWHRQQGVRVHQQVLFFDAQSDHTQRLPGGFRHILSIRPIHARRHVFKAGTKKLAWAATAGRTRPSPRGRSSRRPGCLAEDNRQGRSADRPHCGPLLPPHQQHLPDWPPIPHPGRLGSHQLSR